MQANLDLSGKVAVVTGGTRGIGYATVKKFLDNGAAVCLLGSRQETADQAVAKLKAENPNYKVMGLAPALKDPAAIGEAFAKVQTDLGGLDILVNNAGISQSSPILDYPEGDFAKIMELNVTAMFNCCQEAVKIMRPQHHGVILNTSSMVSIYGQPSGVGYPASKFAVNGLTKSLARELAPDNIRVNAVAPGITRTDMVAALPDQMIQPLIATIPLGRIGEPEDIANAFLFLASDLASYITGTVLSVDGCARA